VFGIGFGEILIVILIVFLISPKELPKLMRKIGQFFGELNRLKREVLQLKQDVEDIVGEAKIDTEIKELQEGFPTIKDGPKKDFRKKAGQKTVLKNKGMNKGPHHNNLNGKKINVNKHIDKKIGNKKVSGENLKNKKIIEGKENNSQIVDKNTKKSKMSEENEDKRNKADLKKDKNDNKESI